MLKVFRSNSWVKASITVFGISAIGLSVALVYQIANRPENVNWQHNYEVEEPEVPISENLTFSSLSSTTDIKSKDKQINSIQYIDSVKYSPDGSKGIVLSWNADPSSAEFSKVKSPTKKLTLIDSKGVILKEIESKDCLYADFTNDNQVYYQKTGDTYGIYAYTIKSDTKKKFIETADPNFFKSIAMIDENKYFFVQPKTGKYGYGDIKTGKLNVIGVKATNISAVTDVDKALYSEPSISPDKKFIALIEDAANNPTLKIFNSSDTKFSTPKFATKINKSVSGKYQPSWTGKFLTFGDQATTIFSDNNSIVYEGDKGKISTIKFSPDMTKVLICSGNVLFSNCRLKNVNIKTGAIVSSQITTEAVLPDSISDAEWLGSDTIAIIVGKSLYDYKISTKKFEKAGMERGDYEFVGINPAKKSMLVKLNQEVKELKFK